jgi:predicted solute-binding protein
MGQKGKRALDALFQRAYEKKMIQNVPELILV